MTEQMKKQCVAKLYNYKSAIEGVIQLAGGVLSTPGMVADAVGDITSKLMIDLGKITPQDDDDDVPM